MESLDYKQVGLLPPNPTTKRGYRVSWAKNSNETHFAYPCQNNVVIRNLDDPTQSVVYTDFVGKVTSVSYSPNGEYIASGDDRGKVKIWSYKQDSKEFIVKKEHSMLNAAVKAIAWTDDGQRLSAAGEGKEVFAKAVLADSGTKIGDLFGPSKAINSIDIKQKPYRLIMSGENFEIYVFDGVPFKHAKTLQVHSNFVNKVSFSPDGKKFVSVSSDKSFVVHNSETLDVFNKIEMAHNKGVMDIGWLDDSSIMTCSTDNTIKLWNIEDGSEIKALQLRDDQTETIEDQQLGLLVGNEKFLSVTLNSNINIWKGKEVFEKDKLTPSEIFEGHSNYVQALHFVQGTLVSSDHDGKLFSWTKDNHAQLFRGEGHTSQVNYFASSKTSLFSGAVDGMIFKSIKDEASSTFQFKSSLKLDGCPIAMFANNEKYLYVLQNNNHLTQIDIESFTVTMNLELKDYEGTALTYVESTNEVWVGDKKGVIHILDCVELNQKSCIEKKHNHALSYMTTSLDGKLVASGDSYRYIYVFNAETQDEIGCYTYHTSKIIHLDFSKDCTLLLTAGLDLTVGVANLADKTKKTLHRTNEKELTCAVFDDENRLYTSGYDCCIRIWSK